MPTPPAATTPRSARGSARLRRRVGTRHGTGVAAVGAGRVSRPRETSERAAFGARGTRTRDATISAALPAPTRPTGAGEIEACRSRSSELAIDPHRVVAIAFRRRRCVVAHNAGHRGMGCVLSSERSADDFGADSRTMLARPKVRVASPPPDGRRSAPVTSPPRFFANASACSFPRRPPRAASPRTRVSRRRRTRFRAARAILSLSIPTADVRFPSLSNAAARPRRDPRALQQPKIRGQAPRPARRQAAGDARVPQRVQGQVP